jgi:hypothetical protein
LRKAVTGALNPYNQLHFEASFKTVAARVKNNAIYFTAGYRWYRELGATFEEINSTVYEFT